MKRDHFEDLKEVVACLKPNEVRTARKFITAFEGNATKGRNKSLLLFELILKKPNLVKKTAIEQFKAQTSKRAFELLTERLITKIFESLSLRANLQRTDLYSENYRVKKLLVKQLDEAKIAYGKGLLKKAISMFDNVIKTGKQYENYNVVIEALSEKQQIEALTIGPDQLNIIAQEISFFEESAIASRQAKGWYYGYYGQIEKSGSNNSKPILNEAISNLGEKFKATQSKTVGYYYKMLLMEYYLNAEEYSKCLKVGESLLNLVKNNFRPFSKAKIGALLSDLGYNNLFTFDFEQAVIDALSAQSFFGIYGFNFNVAWETQFMALFYQNKVDESTSIIKNLIGATDQVTTPFHYAKRIYFKACAHFAAGEFKESLQNLQVTKEIENDKEGWNIGKRLLTILIYLEQSDWDQAETAITNLRMHIQRLKPEETVRKRDAVILKVLQKLILTSFDYQQVLDKHPDLFELLDRTDRDYRWQVKSPEMVVFHHWFQDKAQGIPYQFRVPEPLMKKFGAKSPGRDLDFPVKYP